VTPSEHRGGDPLLAIVPDVYVRRLLGVEVPRHRKVPCPFHEDRHASLHVYETPGRGWYCFGACRRGGTIYDLAAPLYDYTARGEDFLRLRAELHRLGISFSRVTALIIGRRSLLFSVERKAKIRHETAGLDEQQRSSRGSGRGLLLASMRQCRRTWSGGAVADRAQRQRSASGGGDVDRARDGWDSLAG
jgi:hypothetical protein